MSFYPPKISAKFQAPRAVGQAMGANAVGTSATLICGAILCFTLRTDGKTKEILEAKFKTNGCGYLIAAAEVLTENIVGKHLAELHGLNNQILQSEIEGELGKFENSRQHCLRLSLETLHAAFADFRSALIEEWTGEKALVCTCFGVSEETIEQVIKNKSLATVEEVTAQCNAGGGCGSCQPLIEDILEVCWREKA